MNKRVITFFSIALILISQLCSGQVAVEIQNENQKGNAVFLVVTDGESNLSSAREIAVIINRYQFC